jgi:Dolichyl-phosphate-mannose-protein mannosyltransferase
LPSRFSASRAAALLVFPLLAGFATLSVHGETLHYGFHYDDYYFLHPHSTEEVLASFHGAWDLTGVMAKFYRPLTVAFSALRFELFGLNAVAHHALSLTLFAVAAVALAWLVYRFTSQSHAAVLATIFFVCHPAMPYSLVAWITNQMHLLQVLVVLAALVWWDAVRARSVWWWLPLLVLSAAAFLIKEDGVMLLPCIVVLHALRRRIAERDLPPVPVVFVGLSILLVAALVAWRTEVLGELGGYGRPSAERAWSNISGTLYRNFRLLPADREWQQTASWFVTTLPLVAILAGPWISRGARFCMAAGAAIAVIFALPFAFVTKPEQVYLVGTGFSLVLTGAAVGLLDLTRGIPRAAPRIVALASVGLVLAAGLSSLVAVTRAITRDFEPFGPIVLAHDELVQTWGVVPTELKEYLTGKREHGAAARLSSNPRDVVPSVVFLTYGRETTSDGLTYQWMAGTRTEIYVRATARRVTIPVRHALEAFREPARVRVTANGRPVDDIAMTSTEWRLSSIVLRPSDVPRLSGMHHLRITIDRAWRPADVIPGSQDGRVLGVQLGIPDVR